MIKTFLIFHICIILMTSVVYADWAEILNKSKGQKVFFNAWGGSEEINSYIDWVIRRVMEKYNVEMIHVKLSDTSEAVSRILAEKMAGRASNGSVDLIWINGENFANMKRNALLWGPFTESLPNFKLVDLVGKPTTILDFHIPVDGMESPWGMAKFNFAYNSEKIINPPQDANGLLKWASSHPGRFTYPQTDDFLGSTFLMQILIELTEDPDLLMKPVKNEEEFSQITKPLWSYLNQLHPFLWRKGTSFPESNSRLKQMLNDNEVDISLSFNPADTSSAIANGTLPSSTRTFVFEKGTIGNTHFVAIPFNSSSTEGSQVVANFLLSPEAQTYKQDPRIWGDSTVLDLKLLSPEDRKHFENLPIGIATLPPEKLGPTQPNPHPDWKNRIDIEWQKRYGQ